MTIKSTLIAFGTVVALGVAGCSSGSSNKPADASDAAGASADVEWVNPEAPDALKFRNTDLVSGETIDGTSLMYNDVLLWFWASWCPVCNAESEALVAASKDFPDGVKVVGIAGNSGDEPTSQKFIDEHGTDAFPNIYDKDGSIWRAFKITGQPTMVLVNQDGQLRSYSGGYGKFDLIEKVAWLGES